MNDSFRKNEKQQYRYSLDRSSRKFICPQCGNKTYVLYVDNRTDSYLSEGTGRCDRENNCGHHFKPFDFFKQEGLTYEPFENPKAFNDLTTINYIPDTFFYNSMQGNMGTNLANFLVSLYGSDIVEAIFNRYCLGRSEIGNGTASIFYRIDVNDNIRTGKVICYDPVTGKRKKEIAPSWIHTYFKPFNYQLCFFGEHLINQQPYKPIAIVESEKTAIISSIYYTGFIWLATGGKSGMKLKEYSSLKALGNRKIILFPDFGLPDSAGESPYQKWLQLAQHIKNTIVCDVSVSYMLENTLPNESRCLDLDLADILIRRDPATGFALSDDNVLLKDSINVNLLR